MQAKQLKDEYDDMRNLLTTRRKENLAFIKKVMKNTQYQFNMLKFFETVFESTVLALLAMSKIFETSDAA